MMKNIPVRTQPIHLFVISALLAGFTLEAAAQDADNPVEQAEPRSQPRWQIADDATSENNRTLKRILQRYPQADANKDGKLDATEARQLIEDQREQYRERNRGRIDRAVPTFDNVKYGPEDKQHFDLFRADTEEPAPLILYFHGGQFITGDEQSVRSLNINALLEAGISVASIDYRETNTDPFPGPFDDAARAIQFIRFYAEQLHIDSTRIAAIGEEAGGNLALYLALHDDLLDRKINTQLREGTLDDPREVLFEGAIYLVEGKQRQPQEAPAEPEEPQRGSDKDADELIEAFEAKDEGVPDKLDDLVLEGLIPWDTSAIEGMSTRLVAAVARHPIATFDPRAWKANKLPMNDHERLMTKYLDVRYLDPLNDPKVIELVEEVSPLALVSSDDPPLLLISGYSDLPLTDDTVWTIMRHHPRQSKLIANAMRVKGNEAIVRYKGMPNDPGTRTTDFLITHLK